MDRTGFVPATSDPEYPYVRNLAHEIGARFELKHETRAFRVTWVKELAALVGKHGSIPVYEYADDIAAWAGQIAYADGVTLALESTLRRIREEISEKDCDDGWAVDRAGSAMEHVCLAMQPNTRWLAEAGGHVWRFVSGAHGYNDVIAFSKAAWLCDLYRKCAWLTEDRQ